MQSGKTNDARQLDKVPEWEQRQELRILEYVTARTERGIPFLSSLYDSKGVRGAIFNHDFHDDLRQRTEQKKSIKFTFSKTSLI